MRYDVTFTDSADADFDSILHYIAKDNPHRAISFVDELRQRSIDFLSTAPNAGTRVGSHRYFVFTRYVVVYSVDDDARQVRVLLVTEGHRDWRAILGDLAQ
jgi:plasmid stabilization system protein ParE